MPRPFASIPLLLLLSFSGCQPASEQMQMRLDEAQWQFGGCADIVLTAVNEDASLAIELRLEVDTSDLFSEATFELDVEDTRTAATLYDGVQLDDALCSTSNEGSESRIERTYDADAGRIELTVTREPNGGRTAVASARELTFQVGRDAVQIDLDFERVIIGQY